MHGHELDDAADGLGPAVLEHEHAARPRRVEPSYPEVEPESRAFVLPHREARNAAECDAGTSLGSRAGVRPRAAGSGSSFQIALRRSAAAPHGARAVSLGSGAR